MARKSIELSNKEIAALKSLVKERAREESLPSKIREGRAACDPYGKYLEGAVYIVPPTTLLAYQYVNGAHVPVADQTVWVIDEYRAGYCFGKAYVALDGKPSSSLNFVGSVTPSGDVYMTYFSTDGNPKNTDIVSGIGTFRISDGAGYFVMQMNSAQNSPHGLAHWSYMISVRPDDYFYRHLPSLDISVPDFIAQFGSSA